MKDQTNFCSMKMSTLRLMTTLNLRISTIPGDDDDYMDEDSEEENSEEEDSEDDDEMSIDAVSENEIDDLQKENENDQY